MLNSPLGNENNDMSRFRYMIIRNFFTGPILWSVPFFGRRNVVEWFLIFLLIVLMGLGVAGGGEEAGGTAGVLGGMAIFCGMRYNILGFFAGISFERALFWHKCIAVTSIVVSLYHGLAAGITSSSSGFVLMMCMIAVSVLYAVKQAIFEVFYYAHVIVNGIMIIFCFQHGVPFMAFAGFLWLLDLFFRYYLSTSKVEALLEVLPADVVRISYPKGKFRYNAGQYCFVMIPELSMFQFHPFTISSAPHEPEVKFHIRALGDWSKELTKYVADHSVPQEGGGKGVKLSIHVEGPFGIPSIDFDNADVYKVFMLVTGGIGVTPAQSFFNHFIHQYCEGRDIRKCVYLWSVKDRAMLSSIDENRQSHVDLPEPKGMSGSMALPMSFQPNLLDFKPSSKQKYNKVGGDIEAPNKVIPVIDSDSALASGVEMQSVSVVGGSKNDGVVHPKDLPPGMSRRESFSWGEGIASKDPFHVEFNLTSIRNKEDFAKANIDPETQPYVRFGRPNLPANWKAVAEMCVREGIPRVAVLVCGPAPMVSEVQDLCSAAFKVTTKNEAGEEITGSVLFELHCEEFDF